MYQYNFNKIKLILKYKSLNLTVRVVSPELLSKYKITFFIV